MSPTHHTIDYIEIPARDVAASRAFYGAAFGWDFNDYGPDYAGIKGPDGEVGGLAATEGADGGAGGPLVLLYSDDLEATAAAVLAAGGSIVRPAYPFPGGRRLHFTDPTGNELGVWTARTED